MRKIVLKNIVGVFIALVIGALITLDFSSIDALLMETGDKEQYSTPVAGKRG